MALEDFLLRNSIKAELALLGGLSHMPDIPSIELPTKGAAAAPKSFKIEGIYDRTSLRSYISRVPVWMEDSITVSKMSEDWRALGCESV